jgi:hypothetical protein
MKTCPDCEETKEKCTENFYRAGKSWQRRCKPCHNANRKQYRVKSTYVKKGTGFSKLPQETQEAIKLSISNKSTYKKIAQEHGIKYSTLCMWKRTGKLSE